MEKYIIVVMFSVLIGFVGGVVTSGEILEKHVDFYNKSQKMIKECEKDIPRSQTCEIKMQAVVKGE